MLSNWKEILFAKVSLPSRLAKEVEIEEQRNGPIHFYPAGDLL